MDDAVARHHVRRHDIGVVDLHTAIRNRKLHLAALQRLSFQAVGHVGSHHLARHDMVEQDLGKVPRGIRQQSIDRASRQLGKGGVRRRKDRKGAFTLQRIDQPGSLYCRHQRAEITGSHGRIDNVGSGGGFSGALARSSFRSRFLSGSRRLFRRGRGGSRRRFRRGGSQGRRQNDRVDHMDDAIAGLDISSDDVGAVDLGPIGQREGDFLTLQGRRAQPLAQVARHHFPRHNMVEQDLLERPFGVSQQRFDRAFRQLGKGGVGRRKNSVGAFALECFHQASRLDGSHQGGEIARSHCGVDNISGGVLRQRRGREQAQYQGQHKQPAQRGVNDLLHGFSFEYAFSVCT